MNPTSKDILSCPMNPNENDAESGKVGDYLTALLYKLWDEVEGFSGKRPLGNSSWQFDVYIALSQEGLISGLTLDEDGYVDHFSYENEREADRLIMKAINEMGEVTW